MQLGQVRVTIAKIGEKNMKKWLCALSICAVTGLGAFGFAGCGDGNDVASISVKSAGNTTFQVGDVLTPSLKDGVFTVTYKNGRTSDLPLSMADLVYIDYGDNTATDKFVIEANFQNVIVRYKEQTAKFGVKVSKRNLDFDYAKTYSTTYDGTQQSARDVLDFVLPNGTYISGIEYKPHANTDADEFTTTAPSEAGQYDLKITINGGSQYNNKIIDDIVYEIAKADVSDALNTTVNLNDIIMQYGDSTQLNTNWTVGKDANAYFSTALKSEFKSLANEVKFAYKASNATQFTDVKMTDGKYDLSSLAVGDYTLRAYVNNLANFKDFHFDSSLTIGTRQLQYGTDYDIDLIQNATMYKYSETTDPTDIQNTIATADPTTITIRVNFLSAVAKNAFVKDSTKIFFQYSQSNNANWGSNLSAMQDYGYYKIIITTQFQNDACTFGDTFFGVIVEAPNSGTDGE